MNQSADQPESRQGSSGESSCSVDKGVISDIVASLKGGSYRIIDNDLNEFSAAESLLLLGANGTNSSGESFVNFAQALNRTPRIHDAHQLNGDMRASSASPSYDYLGNRLPNFAISQPSQYVDGMATDLPSCSSYAYAPTSGADDSGEFSMHDIRKILGDDGFASFIEQLQLDTASTSAGFTNRQVSSTAKSESDSQNSVENLFLSGDNNSLLDAVLNDAGSIHGLGKQGTASLVKYVLQGSESPCKDPTSSVALHNVVTPFKLSKGKNAEENVARRLRLSASWPNLNSLERSSLTLHTSSVKRFNSSPNLSTIAWRDEFHRGAVYGRTVTIADATLPCVVLRGNSTAEHGDAELVCISDVFQAFFASRHWDTFKEILEQTNVKPFTVDVFVDPATGRSDVIEALTVEQIQFLLLSNSARRDGFARCLKLNAASFDGGTATSLPLLENGMQFAAGTSAGCSASISPSDGVFHKIINVSERRPGELSSGIRTRQADQDDVSYVELDGHTLPCLAKNGQQVVRLVDVLKNVLGHQTVTHNQISALKDTCEGLGIKLTNCSSNEKTRLVVYANSLRHAGLSCVSVTDLPRLVAAELEKRQRLSKNVAKRGSKSGPASRTGRATVRMNGKQFAPRKRLKKGMSLDLDQTYSDAESTSSRYSKQFSSVFDSSDADSTTSELTSTIDEESGYGDDFNADTRCSSRESFYHKPAAARSVQQDQAFFLRREGGAEAASTGRTDAVYSPLVLPSSSMPDVGERNAVGASTDANSHASVHKFQKYSKRRDEAAYELSLVSNEEDKKSLRRKIRKYDSKASKYQKLAKDELEPLRDVIDLNTQYSDASINVAENVTIAALVEQTKSCCVQLVKSPPLSIIVRDERLRRSGPVGLYFDHLWVSKLSPSVLCSECNSYFSVSSYLCHNCCGSEFEKPVFMMVIDNPECCRFNLWHSFSAKARQFLQLGRDQPPDLLSYYEAFGRASRLTCNFSDDYWKALKQQQVENDLRKAQEGNYSEMSAFGGQADVDGEDKELEDEIIFERPSSAPALMFASRVA